MDEEQKALQEEWKAAKAWRQLSEELSTEEGRIKAVNKMQRDSSVRQHGEIKGRLLYAFEALVRSSEDGEPLDAEDIKALADAALRYTDGRDRYFGEYGGNDLLMQKRDKFGKRKRELAVQDLVRIRMVDTEKPLTPLDNETYDRVARKRGLDRSTLQREVTKRRQQKQVAVNEKGDLVFAKLGDLLKKK